MYAIIKDYPEYSLVFIPPQYIVMEVDNYKILVKEEIGKYGSDGSIAHISIFGFDADEIQLQSITSEITAFCKTVFAKDVAFISIKKFGNQTLYLDPSKDSKKYLNKIIRDFHTFIGVKFQNINAHMSIARDLDAEKMEKSFNLFKGYEVNLLFYCDTIVLRKFNKTIGEYSDIATFKLQKHQQLDLFE